MYKTLNPTLLAAGVIFAAASSVMAAPSAASIMADIERHGPARELSQLTHEAGEAAGESQYDTVLAKVQQGQSDWLAVAARIYPATDAGNREMLLTGLSEAIQNNPAGVMRLVDTVFRIDDICANRLIEPSSAESESFLKKTRAALRTLQDGRLRARRDACLRLLSRGRTL